MGVRYRLRIERADGMPPRSIPAASLAELELALQGLAVALEGLGDAAPALTLVVATGDGTPAYAGPLDAVLGTVARDLAASGQRPIRYAEGDRPGPVPSPPPPAIA